MPSFAKSSEPSCPVYPLTKADFASWLTNQDERTKTTVNALSFSAAAGTICPLLDADGNLERVLAGLGTEKDQARERFTLAAAVTKLPEGTYRLDGEFDPDTLAEHALAWLLADYKFARYRKFDPHPAKLICPAALDAAAVEAVATGEALTRDLINTPASDMGPAELENAAKDLAKTHGASVEIIESNDLLTQNFPMIHTVGRASDRPPRLIDMSWGKTGPTLVLVGKGVCFDTGGLNLKPGASMGLMKKDMGGAAAVLGLAHMIMATGLGLRLRVLIPAVENSVSGNAFRPQDVLTSRKGLTVEINNTDAEGRLVLADALALADEGSPDLIISMATLTGAARVAVGPDLAPFYTDDETLSVALQDAAKKVRDPVWRMPFYDPYEKMIEPGIADLDNAPSGGFAGSITAALFLRRFVENAPYLHFDIYGWQPGPAPARPKGGVGQGTRALFEVLPRVLNL